MRQNPAWSLTKNQLPTAKKHNISDNLILLLSLMDMLLHAPTG